MSKRTPKPGWVEAPGYVAQELELVWQEDEMPAELKSMAGYTPFTLSPDAQIWVDSMLEVREEGGAVYGRPKPVVPREHVIRAQPPSTLPVMSPMRSPTPPPHTPPRVYVEEEVAPRPLPVIGRGTKPHDDSLKPRVSDAEGARGLLVQRKRAIDRARREAMERQKTADLFGSTAPASSEEDRGIPKIG